MQYNIKDQEQKEIFVTIFGRICKFMMQFKHIKDFAVQLRQKQTYIGPWESMQTLNIK